MDEPYEQMLSVREQAVALITALIHEDNDAVDFVLFPLTEWPLRALCVSLAEQLVEQIRFISTFEGQDPTETWALALVASRQHPSAGGFDA